MRRGDLRGIFPLDPKSGLLDQFGSTGDLELLLDVRPVGFDGFHAQAQFVGGLLGAATVPDHAEDFEFPVAELLDR